LAVGCGGAQPEASSPKIIGGELAKDRPFMAALVDRFGDSGFCGGTFIKPDVVLTAAHCVADGWTGVRVAGGTQLNTGLTSSHTAAISKVVVHESYSDRTHDNDLALIWLKQADLARFGGKVHPIDYGTDLTAPEQAGKAIVSGWGTTAAGEDSYPDELREVTVPIIDKAKCISAGGEYKYVTERQVCAGDWDHGGIDSCQGDSGGPLFLETADATPVDTIVGIVSWGEGCADKKKPGVYTRVASYKSWIEGKLAAR
jgi:secreted trypsin-like serine protease